MGVQQNTLQTLNSHYDEANYSVSSLIMRKPNSGCGRHVTVVFHAEYVFFFLFFFLSVPHFLQSASKQTVNTLFPYSTPTLPLCEIGQVWNWRKQKIMEGGTWTQTYQICQENWCQRCELLEEMPHACFTYLYKKAISKHEHWNYKSPACEQSKNTHRDPTTHN